LKEGANINTNNHAAELEVEVGAGAGKNTRRRRRSGMYEEKQMHENQQLAVGAIMQTSVARNNQPNKQIQSEHGAAAACKLQSVFRGRVVRQVMHDAKLQVYNQRGKLMPLDGTEAGSPGWYQSEDECYRYGPAEGSASATGRGGGMSVEPVGVVSYRQYVKANVVL
jgi:hypothetical protein